jgi:hypothetical protein
MGQQDGTAHALLLRGFGFPSRKLPFVKRWAVVSNNRGLLGSAKYLRGTQQKRYPYYLAWTMQNYLAWTMQSEGSVPRNG